LTLQSYYYILPLKTCLIYQELLWSYVHFTLEDEYLYRLYHYIIFRISRISHVNSLNGFPTQLPDTTLCLNSGCYFRTYSSFPDTLRTLSILQHWPSTFFFFILLVYVTCTKQWIYYNIFIYLCNVISSYTPPLLSLISPPSSPTGLLLQK
jgi:hypothetical protein